MIVTSVQVTECCLDIVTSLQSMEDFGEYLKKTIAEEPNEEETCKSVINAQLSLYENISVDDDLSKNHKLFQSAIRVLSIIARRLPNEYIPTHISWFEENVINEKKDIPIASVLYCLEYYLFICRENLNPFIQLSREIRFVISECDQKNSFEIIDVSFTNIDIKTVHKVLTTLLNAIQFIAIELECAIEALKTLRKFFVFFKIINRTV